MKNYQTYKIPLFKDEFNVVYDLQKEVIKRTGIIDEMSDLVAAFERRSLRPEKKLIDILFFLVTQNTRGESRKKFKDLFSLHGIVYVKKMSFLEDQEIWEPVRLENNNSKNYKYKQDLGEEKTGNIQFGNNEFLYEFQGYEMIVTIAPKYASIVRLVINNIYIPQNYKMKQRNMLILGIAIIFSSMILGVAYAYSNRYVVDKGYYIIDKWTKTVHELTWEKK